MQLLLESVTPERIRQNADVFGFTLDEADMTAVAALDRGDAGRIGPDPDSLN